MNLQRDGAKSATADSCFSLILCLDSAVQHEVDQPPRQGIMQGSQEPELEHAILNSSQMTKIRTLLAL